MTLRVAHVLVRHADPIRISPHLFDLKDADGPDLFDDLDIPKRIVRTARKATAMIELVAWLEAHRIDILHIHSYRPNLYGRMAGVVLQHAGLKIVAHYHNDYSDKWDGDALILERRLARHTDAAVAVSDAVALHVADMVELQAEVIGNGVDLDRATGGDRLAGRARLGLAPDHFAVGLIGRICRQKGVDTFVEAAFQVASDQPSARFLIVGEPENAELARKLRRRVAAGGLALLVSFCGHREDIGDVLAALDLLAAPSRWEGFGLSLAEAMAAGIPAIASNVGGIPAVSGQAARLFAPDDAKALARGIVAIIGDSALRASMADLGRPEARRFDWACPANRLQALYDRIGGDR